MIDIDPQATTQTQLQATMKALPGVLEVGRFEGRGGGGAEGGYLFVACLSHLTIDHASLSRRSIISTLNNTSNIWALSTLLPYMTKLFAYLISFFGRLAGGGGDLSLTPPPPPPLATFSTMLPSRHVLRVAAGSFTVGLDVWRR